MAWAEVPPKPDVEAPQATTTPPGRSAPPPRGAGGPSWATVPADLEGIAGAGATQVGPEKARSVETEDCSIVRGAASRSNYTAVHVTRALYVEDGYPALTTPVRTLLGRAGHDVGRIHAPPFIVSGEKVAVALARPHRSNPAHSGVRRAVPRLGRRPPDHHRPAVGEGYQRTHRSGVQLPGQILRIASPPNSAITAPKEKEQVFRAGVEEGRCTDNSIRSAPSSLPWPAIRGTVTCLRYLLPSTQRCTISSPALRGGGRAHRWLTAGRVLRPHYAPWP